MSGKWHLGHMKPYLPHNHGFDSWTGMPWSHDFCPCPTSLTHTGDNVCRNFYPPCPLYNDSTIVEQPAILENVVDYYVDSMIEFIDETNRKTPDRPWFGYYACHHTHHPQFANPKFIGKSEEGRGAPRLVR